MTAKSPTHESNLVPRKPAQERTRVRFEALVDAADQLLLNGDISKIGLYDIAAAASMPPASAYHLFPTKEAVLVALAERYLAGLGRYMHRPFEPGTVQSWQEYVTVEMRRAIEFYNQHPVMRKLFLAGNIISEITILDTRNIEAASASTYDRMNRVFHMPYIRNHELKFSALIGIYDGIWMASCARHGRITEDFARETEQAALAYCATFLPPVLPLRTPDPAESAR